MRLGASVAAVSPGIAPTREDAVNRPVKPQRSQDLHLRVLQVSQRASPCPALSPSRATWSPHQQLARHLSLKAPAEAARMWCDTLLRDPCRSASESLCPRST